MQNLMVRLWNDDCGYILSAESVFLFTITVLGLVAGWATLRNAVVSELMEVGNAIGSLNQGYSFSGIVGCKSSSAGSNLVGDSQQCIGFTSSTPVAFTCNVLRCP